MIYNRDSTLTNGNLTTTVVTTSYYAPEAHLRFYEKNLTTTVVTTSYYLGGTLVAQREDTTLRYAHQDHLTGTSLMTDTNGNSLGTMKYYPYGDCRNSQGTVATDRLFTGQRLDGTGLYYYRARYYDPVIGRFISPDTIIPNPADPQSYNRYSYCLNNPLKYVDPSGHVVDILGYDARYLDSLANSPEALSLALSNDPGLVDVLTSAEYNAHKAAQASDPDWVSGLEQSETTYDVEILSESSTSTTSTVLYVSESVTYSKQVQSVHVAAPHTQCNSYADFNVTAGIGKWVVTGGFMFNDDGFYPYFGGGSAQSIGVVSISLTHSESAPTTGLNTGVQGAMPIGPLPISVVVQTGTSPSELTLVEPYFEWGVGVGLGTAETAFWVWEW